MPVKRAIVQVMNLHHAGLKPQWEGIVAKELNGWQRVAVSTSGVITPANAITIIGLVGVIIGLLLVGRQQYIAGLLLILIGRICDLLDGIVAEMTRTKSPLGEFLDAMVDKLASLAALLVLGGAGIIPLWVVTVILLANLTNVILTVVAKYQKAVIHPSKYGKLFMAYSWACLLGFVLAAASWHNTRHLFEWLAYALLAITLMLEFRAANDYRTPK